MNKSYTCRSWSTIFVFIILVFTLSVSVPAQKLIPPAWSGIDQSPVVFPFDFNDEFYALKGVDVKYIMGRRTGEDGLSVFDKTGGSVNNMIRVTATMPAYDQNGESLFWYPLGDLPYNGFTDDKIGARARQLAQQYPIYVFPDRNTHEFAAFTNTRQASLMNNSNGTRLQANPLGLRVIFYVNYTEKAFGKEGMDIMNYFGKKNGLATDDTPILKSLDDITFLQKNGFVTVDQYATAVGLIPSGAQYAMSPMITLKGSIAKDAFLWMPTKDGQPLPAEQIFSWHFGCMKETGDRCE